MEPQDAGSLLCLCLCKLHTLSDTECLFSCSYV